MGRYRDKRLCIRRQRKGEKERVHLTPLAAGLLCVILACLQVFFDFPAWIFQQSVFCVMPASVSRREVATWVALMFRRYGIGNLYVGWAVKVMSDSAEKNGNGSDI